MAHKSFVYIETIIVFGFTKVSTRENNAEYLIEEKVFVPAGIQNDAKLALSKITPKKSKDIYEKKLGLFNSWREEKGISGINEEILLAYFVEIGKKNVGSSMWTKYSMLKATLKFHKNVDISKYGRLISFLKSESRAHKPKKAKILEKEQFLRSAPDSEYLMEKIALIMGIAGACRCNELTNLSVEHIEDKGSYLYISIPDTKTNKPRSFTIINKGYPVSPIDVYRNYVSLRPAKVPHRRFFFNYKSKMHDSTSWNKHIV